MKNRWKVFNEGLLEKINFGRDGFLIDVVLQNYADKKVLFGASMNKEALEETIRRKTVVLWSKSQGKLWVKGETSGDYLRVISIMLNCEKNQLLIQVFPLGKGVCHTRDRKGKPRKSCFYRLLLEENIVMNGIVSEIEEEDGTKLSFIKE